MYTPTIKYVKFYTTGSAEVVIFNLVTNETESKGTTHEFADSSDMLAKTTKEVFSFWDGVPVGQGSVQA